MIPTLRVLWSMVSLGLVTCVAALLPSTAVAGRVWYEYGLATVTTGIDTQTRAYVHRKFYAVAFGPDTLPGHDSARACTATVLPRIAEALRKSLWKIKFPVPPTDDTSPAKEIIEAEGAARDKAVDQLIDSAVRAFKSQFTACARGRFDSGQFQLALIQRICDGRTTSCANVEKSYADHPAAVAFTVLSMWIDARDGDNPTLPANHLILLPDIGAARTALKTLGVAKAKDALEKCRSQALPRVNDAAIDLQPRPPTCLALEMASRPFVESNTWDEPQPAAVMQEQLEALVVQARREKQKIERNVPRILETPREVAVRMIDALSEPQEAILDLKSDASKTLRTISDELARSRIVECVRFRNVTDADKVSTCAGYKLDAAAVNSCLANARCVPPLGEQGWRGVLVILETEGRKQLSQQAMLSRLSTKHSALVALTQACSKAKTKADAATCLLEGQLGERERKAWACIRGKSASQIDSSSVQCAVGGSLPPVAVSAIECAKKHKNPSDQAFCAAGASLSPEARAVVACLREYKGAQDIAKCVVGRTVRGDAGKVVGCVMDGGDDWSRVALCYAGSTKLPPAAAQAVACVQKAGGSTSSVAGCMALQQLPDSVRKPAQCLAESGGDPLGAGVCMASDGLNADQRIALQCLASTGGEPTSFATCTAGRLAVKEMFNCVDKKLFEDKCVGPNNEIRKFVEAIFPGQKLTPNTVAGQVLNAPIDVIKFQVAAAQALGKGLEKVAHNIGREGERAAQNIGRELQRGGQNVGREARRIGNQAKTDVNNGINWVEKRSGVRLPRL